MQGLTPGGILIFTTGGLDEPTEKVDSSMGPPVYYSVLGIPQTLRLIDECGCVCRHLEYDQYPESHLYVIVQKKLGLTHLPAGAAPAGEQSQGSNT